MVKWGQFAAIAAVAMGLAGCDPKRVQIPSDPDKWGNLEVHVKELNEDDQKLFAQYMARHVVGVAFDDRNAGIPDGMTIGKAIEAQKKVRIVQDNMGAAGGVLSEGGALISRTDIEREISNTVQVRVSGPHIVAEDNARGRFSDWFGMSVDVQNRSGKTILGIKGVVVVEDVFGVAVSRIDLQMNEEVAAGGRGKFDSYGKSLNRYNKSDVRLRSANFSKLRMRFQPEVIAFSDGTRLNLMDVPA